MKLYSVISSTIAVSCWYRSPVAQAKALKSLSTSEIDCETFISKTKEIRGPRPDYDDYYAGDMTPEETQAQIRFCEEQLALEQEQADRESEMDTKLQLKWVNENWDKIKITLDECDTWRSNRGSRPDVEMDDKAMKVLKEYKIENLSQATIEVYCDELERRTEETAADKVFYDDSSSSSSISSSVESDYDSNAEKELRNFPDRMYDTVNDEAANDLITNLEICEAYPSVCCPLFESFGDIYSTGAFSNDTIDALNSAEIKSECAKYEFMSCCVFTDLCSIYPNLAHCQPANSAALVEAVKLQFRAASSTSTSTTTTTTTSTSTTTTSTSTKKTTSDVVNSDVEPVTNDQSFGGIDARIVDSDSSTDIPVNDKIIGATDGNGQNGGGVSTKSPEEIQEIEEDAASRGITILIVVIGLIVLMAIAVIVSKHFFAGDGEEPVAAGEDDGLLVTNATQKPLDQIPEDNEAQQVQQQTEQEPVQQQAQEEQFQQQQVQN